MEMRQTGRMRNPLNLMLILLVPLWGWANEAQNVDSPTAIDKAFCRLYNFDFAGAQTILKDHSKSDPADPLSYSVQAAAYLFSEMYRLQILQTEFFVDDNNIVSKKNLKADPIIRTEIFNALDQARQKAMARLNANPSDRDALFAMCMSAGVETDYTALIERRQWRGLKMARQANSFAQKLLNMNPPFYDAYNTSGMIEYTVGSLPFFLRWFIHFDRIEGDKATGIRNLKMVAQFGRYYGPFSRILLAVIYLREKKTDQAEQLLTGLTNEFPENPLFKSELTLIRAKLAAKR
jgi:hypothetical protein